MYTAAAPVALLGNCKRNSFCRHIVVWSGHKELKLCPETPEFVGLIDDFRVFCSDSESELLLPQQADDLLHFG